MLWSQIRLLLPQGQLKAPKFWETEGLLEATMVTVNASSKVTAVAGADAKIGTGWVKQDDQWSYINSDGSKATGFLNLGSSTFYLDQNGVLKTGWFKVGKNYYYADPDNEGRLKTGWLTYNDARYYLDPETFARYTGIHKVDGKLYVFSDAGRRRTGPVWVTTSKGKCYVKKDNTLQTGWLKYGSNWYYFDGSGVMKTGKLITGNKTYFLNDKGQMRTGWFKYGSSTYYLTSDGYAAKGWKIINGLTYFFKSNGVMMTGWYKPSGKIYYFRPSGNMVTGCRYIGNSKYLLRKDGAYTKGWQKFSGKWYYFDKNCKMMTGWLTLGSRKFYLNKNGVMLTGYHTIGGTRYYFASDGALVPNTYSYSNRKEFIECIAPLIQKYAPMYGVKVVSPIIAQAILESASGESRLSKEYNNFFGLKCGTLWTGKSVNMLTGEEYTPGTYTTISANFRAYDNMEEGVKGYFEFLFRNRTRYNNLIGETNPYRYLEKIKEDGYATSSRYVQNTYAVLVSENLTRFDK